MTVVIEKCLFSAPFSFLGDLRPVYQRVMPTEFREIWYRHELHADSAVTAWVPNPGQDFVIDEAALDLCPNLGIIVTPSTGSNHIDRKACARRGVAVYSLLDHRSRLEQIAASAEFTFLLLLGALRRVDLAFGEVARRRWRANEDALRGRELAGRTVGLLGYGRIGRRLARYCRAFDTQVRACDPYVAAADLPLVDIETLFAEHEAVVICCSLTPETIGLVGERLLDRLKPGAVVVNSARGEILQEQATRAALAALEILAGRGTPIDLTEALVAR
ncbi:MAG: hypothetical protein HY023_05955 [Chloroflexi bacterium]|nr:hypothetical protein [Chloroflexota bacterium]